MMNPLEGFVTSQFLRTSKVFITKFLNTKSKTLEPSKASVTCDPP